MSNPAAKVNTKVTATFDKNEAEKFLTPLSDFQRVCGTKISLRFNKDNTLSVKAMNDSKNVIVYFNYLPTGLPSLKVTEECRGHIFELDELVSLSRIFNNGFEFVYNETEKCLELNSGDENLNQSFKYYLCDETVITKAPESLNTSKIVWVANFQWDSKKYANFVKGMSSLKHPYVIFEGKKGEKTITLAITENKMKTTTLKTVIKVENENVDNFRVVLNKENFLNPVTSSVTNFSISLCSRLISLVGKSEYHEITYFITPVVETQE
jgi:hypothetical protein